MISDKASYRQKCSNYCLAYTGSVYLTLLLTVERFVAVCMPFRAKSFLNSRRTKCWIGVIFLFSILLNSPRWIESYAWNYAYDSRYWNCFHTPSLMNIEEYITIYHLYIWTALMYVIPFIMIVCLNFKIWSQVSFLLELMFYTASGTKDFLSSSDSECVFN